MKRFALLTLAGVMVLNVVAFLHARAMTHFQRGGSRTANAEALSAAGKLKVLVTGVTMPRPVNRNSPADFGLPFETIKVKGARGSELEVWRIRVANSRGIVLLFHGYTGSKDALLPVAREFLALGFEPWLVDFHGSGGSTGNTTSIGWHEAEDVANVFARAQAEVLPRRTVVFGSSMGAAAALRAVHAHGIRPAALILECPFNRMLDTAADRFALMKLPAFPFAHCLVFWGGVQQGFNAFAHNPEDYARSVRCPTLLMQGGRDGRVTLPQARSIATNLRTNCTLKIFPELGHESYLAANPGEWRKEVTDFLGRAGR
ncbi:MAG: alpha/beta fold hydrolase [Verrucomicrobia bacterium]|nr:alpha/beta fold hydrolase [Verrucomicrobiota bacterium]